MAVVCAIVVGVGMGVAGCGGSGGGSGADGGKSSAGKGGDDVARMSSALKTLKGYDSVHMDGSYPSVGQVDLRADRDGNCVGTVNYVGQGVAEVIYSAGERSWYRYDDATLAHWRRIVADIGPEALALHDKAAKKARGKYIESVRAEVRAEPLLKLCDLDRAFAEVPDSVSEVKPRNPETRAGKRVVGLVQQPEGDEVTVYVPVKGDPTPHRAEFEIDDEPVEIDITDPGKPVKATPPPASETVTAAEATGLFPEFPESMQSQ